MDENEHESCKGERRSSNSRLLQKIEERWEAGRTDMEDDKKKPLLEYEEWAAIDRAVGEEGRTQHALGEQEKKGGTSRWDIWEGKKTSGAWRWLTELGFCPRRRPVRNSTEQMGRRQTGKEEESLPGTEIEEGQTERDIDLIDRGKEPKLTEKERSRLKTC